MVPLDCLPFGFVGSTGGGMGLLWEGNGGLGWGREKLMVIM